MSQTATEPQNNTSRKVKALLAGGLVLGVGAAVTLAAWTDQEWAEGIFGTGTFNIQSSVDGTTFDDHEAEGEAATLVFDLPVSENMSPGDTVAAPFFMQLDADTTYDAEVELTAANSATENENYANLTYGITEVSSADECTAEATGTPIVSAGTALDATGDPASMQLTAGAEGEAGAPLTLCFQVTADDGLTEDTTTNATWQFTGTSVE